MGVSLPFIMAGAAFAGGTAMQVSQQQKMTDAADHTAKVQKEQQDKLNRDLADKDRAEKDQEAKDLARDLSRRNSSAPVNASRGGTVLTSPLGVSGAAPVAGGKTLLGS